MAPGGDLMAFFGDNGQIVMVSARSKQVVGMARVGSGHGGTSDLRAISFSPDGQRMACAGNTGGYLYLFDIRKSFSSFSNSVTSFSTTPLEKIVDEGTLRCTALAWSPCGKYVATGSNSGVVNMYATHSGTKATNRLYFRKAVTNLVTSIGAIHFSPDGQAMVYASMDRRNALRILHTESCSTFSNWPTQKTPLDRVSAVAISPGAGFLALGNDRGRALLYRMPHYPPM